MQTRSLLRSGIGIAAAALTSTACTAASPANPPLNTACYKSYNGKQLFIGSPNCLLSKEGRRFHGFLVIDHEYLVFYEKLPSQQLRYDTSTYWVDMSKNNLHRALSYFRGKRVILSVSGFGHFSTEKGIYGDGEFKKGLYIDKIFALSYVRPTTGSAIVRGSKNT